MLQYDFLQTEIDCVFICYASTLTLNRKKTVYSKIGWDFLRQRRNDEVKIIALLCFGV